MSRPGVSVIIPVFNGERYVAEAIESCLAQTCQAAEIIVVDDASKDNSSKVVASFPQVSLLINSQNSGPVASRLRAVRESAGEFIAFLDHDDLWLPEKLERQADFLETHETTEIVLAHVQQFLSPDRVDELRSRFRAPSRPQPGYCHSAVMIRRECFVGLAEHLDGRSRSGEAVVFFSQAIGQDVPIHVLSETLVLRRIHGDNATIQDNVGWRTRVPRIIKAKLDRERAEKNAGKTPDAT